VRAASIFVGAMSGKGDDQRTEAEERAAEARRRRALEALLRALTGRSQRPS